MLVFIAYTRPLIRPTNQERDPHQISSPPRLSSTLNFSASKKLWLLPQSLRQRSTTDQFNKVSTGTFIGDNLPTASNLHRALTPVQPPPASSTARFPSRRTWLQSELPHPAQTSLSHKKMLAAALTHLSSTTAPHHTSTPLAAPEALSGILGSISLCCWIFLLLPQLLENYRNSSAEAVSLAFIFVWFLGDVCNLAGALWAGLVPVIVAIAVYFCISDGVLISQCLYYAMRERRRRARVLLARERGESVSGGESAIVRDEREPLLGRSGTGSAGSYTGTIPGSGERRRSSQGSTGRRRSSATAAAREARNEQLAKILEETDESGARLWLKNVLSVLGIVVVGTAGWAAAYGTGAWKPSPQPGSVHAEEVAAGAQVLGYASAVLYLGARLPQIYKNWQEKSCEGEYRVTGE